MPAHGDAVANLTAVGDGWETEIWSFDLNETPLILRLYPGAGAAAKAELEFQTIRQLAELGYPVPRLLALELDATLLGGPFLLMERIHGPLMGHAYGRAPADQREGILRDFVRLLVGLHALDWRPFAADPGAVPTCASESLNRLWALVRGIGRADLAQPLFEHLSRRAATVATWRPALVHYDFHLHNILLRDGNAPVVIDWSSAEVSDPRTDLAWTALLLTSWDRALSETVLAEYQRQSGQALADFDYFEAVALTRRVLSIVISIMDGAGSLGMRPGLEEQLKGQMGYVRQLYAMLKEKTGVALPVVESLLAQGQ